MDTGRGTFAEVAEPIAEKLRGAGLDVFKVGDVVALNGSRFKVSKIAKKRLVLRLLPIAEDATR